MTAEETLLNASLVLIPVWLGVIRYIINETEFDNKELANIIGLGMVSVLIGLLFSMWIAIEQLVIRSPELDIGLYVLFITVGLTGIGGILFIIREIDHISGVVVTGIPVGIVLIGVLVIFAPQFIDQLPDASVNIFLIVTQMMAILSIILNLLVKLQNQIRIHPPER